ncbi:MAG TPA: hypothetical protein VFR80_13320, partial [Pyrinomonadaceae bacterium]|nr:hypothetical protein [Pyrinomonadaceae bacterium]
MKKNFVSALLIATFLLAGSLMVANAGTAEGDVPAPPAIGSTIADFTLPDVSGKEHSLTSLAGKNGSVLIFIA